MERTLTLVSGILAFASVWLHSPGISAQSSRTVNETDSLALVALYNATDGVNWDNNSGWLTGTVNTWYGVTLSNDTVQQINLFNNNLTGDVPADIGSFTGLVSLNLSWNHLTGPIPEEIGLLTRLTHLSMFFNDMSGGIPPSLGGLSSLVELTISYNFFTGMIPPELGELDNLTNLDVSWCQLSDSIPVALTGMDNLRWLDIHDNNLSGEIPMALCDLPSLQYFVYNHNYFDTSSCAVIECMNSRGIQFTEGGGWQRTGILLPDACHVPQDLSVVDTVVNYESPVCFGAYRTIYVAGEDHYFVVEYDGYAELVARQNIEILPGSYVEEGGYLWAHIRTDGTYCGPQQKVALPATVQGAPGIEEPRVRGDQSLTVFPNPSEGICFVLQSGDCRDSFNVIRVFDPTGITVLQQVLTGPAPWKIDLAGHAAGIYLVMLSSGKGVSSFKLILQ